MIKINYRGVSWVGIEYNISGWVSLSLVKLGSDSRLYCSLITVKPNDKQSGLVVHKALEAHDFHESDYRGLNPDSIAF